MDTRQWSYEETVKFKRMMHRGVPVLAQHFPDRSYSSITNKYRRLRLGQDLPPKVRLPKEKKAKVVVSTILPFDPLVHKSSVSKFNCGV